jgi:GNAT superfamily N-acetyltransferase
VIHIEPLCQADVARLAEIDRSERVRVGYAWRDGRVVAEEVDRKAPPWSREGGGPHSVAAMIAFGAASLERGGSFLGAAEGDRLAGVAIVRCRLTVTMAQLAFLHVSRAYRKRCVATRLLCEARLLARQDGAVDVRLGYPIRIGRRPLLEPGFLSHGRTPSRALCVGAGGHSTGVGAVKGGSGRGAMRAVAAPAPQL